jgi:acetyltransferase-like isoleucine patch superfamily enzyme
LNSRHLEHDWFSRQLPENVQIGAASFLYSSFAFIHCKSQMPQGVRIGHHSGVYNGTFFDLGPSGEVTIGDYCSLVGAIFATNGRVSIGDYSFIAHEVVIADHDCSVVGDHSRADLPHIASTASIEHRIVIGANVWIGAQATLIGSIKVGEGAIIGTGTVVRENVPPYTVWAGNPSRKIRLLPIESTSNDHLSIGDFPEWET